MGRIGKETGGLERRRLRKKCGQARAVWSGGMQVGRECRGGWSGMEILIGKTLNSCNFLIAEPDFGQVQVCSRRWTYSILCEMNCMTLVVLAAGAG